MNTFTAPLRLAENLWLLAYCQDLVGEHPIVIAMKRRY